MLFSRKSVPACALGLILGLVVSPIMWLTYYDPLLQSIGPICDNISKQSARFVLGGSTTAPLGAETGEGGGRDGKGGGFVLNMTGDAIQKLNLSAGEYESLLFGSPEVRSRRLANELAPRGLLFVGVVTARKYLDTRAAAIHDTWGRGLSDVYYFSSPPENGTSDLLIITLPGVNDTVYPPQRKVYRMLKYMHDHYIDQFDFFMRSDDDVYVKTDLLTELLMKVNPAQDIYMGCPGFGRPDDRSRIKLSEEEHYCMGGPGVIFSRSALRRLAPHLEECLESVVVSYNEDVEVGRCVSKMLNIQCTWSWETAILFWTDYKRILPTPELYTSDSVENAITLHPIKDPRLMHRVHQYALELRFKRLMKEVGKLQSDLQLVSKSVPEEMQHFKLKRWLWHDIGTNPSTRYKLPIWEYFNSSHLFLNYEHLPVLSLPTDVSKGINMALEVLVEKMNQNRKQSKAFLPPYHLFDGYMLTDHSSGVQYSLHLSVHKESSSDPIDFSASIFLPLQGAGMATYQQTKKLMARTVHIVINIGKQADLGLFVQTYESVCIRNKLKTHLHVVYFGTEEAARQQIVELVSRHPSKAISSYEIMARKFSPSNGYRHVSEKLAGDDLLLLMDYHFIFTKEFIEHVQLNTVKGQQAYFPILFSLYKPELVSRYAPKSLEAVISADSGFFLRYNYQAVAVYNSDYDTIRNVELNSTSSASRNDDVIFVDKALVSGIYVFRALEPYLRRDYRPRTCDSLSGSAHTACMNSKVDSIGSKKILGSLLITHDLLDAV